MIFRHVALTHRLIQVLSLALLAALVGCGPPKARVSGKVTYKAELVTAGTVTFYGAGDKVASAPIGPDGTYESKDVPMGEVKVTVTTPLPPDPNAAEKAKANPMLVAKNVNIKQQQENLKVVPVPRKYSLPGTSGIGLTVKEGSQPFDIELK
jgi:hypothetical protein